MYCTKNSQNWNIRHLSFDYKALKKNCRMSLLIRPAFVMTALMIMEKICQFWCILKFILNYFFSFKKIYQVIPCLETFSGLKQASNFLNKLSQLNSIHLKRESYTFECSFVVNVIFF